MSKKSKTVEKKSKKEDPIKKKSKFRRLLTKKNILIAVISLLLLIQYIQVQSIFGTFSFLEGRDSSLITEIGQIKDSYTKIGMDLNEVRGFLRLPTETYATIDSDLENSEDEANTNEVQLALFQYMDYLATSRQIEEKISNYRGMLDAIEKSESFQAYLAENGLISSGVIEEGTGIVQRISAGENELVVFYLATEDGTFYRKTAKEKVEVEYEDVTEFEAELKDFLNENKDDLVAAIEKVRELRAQVEEAINSEEVQAKALELGITLSAEGVEANLEIVYSIYNKSEEVIGQIVINTEDGIVNLIDTKDTSAIVQAGSDGPDLVSFLAKLNTKTFIENKVDEARAEIENTINDEGFQLLLKEYAFSIGEEIREDDERIYYDIYFGDSHVSSIVVEKMTGVINIVQPDGTNGENLLFFDPDFKKKTLEIPDEVPDYGSDLSHEDNTFNILVAGKHGSLVDTMIFVHIDELKREIRMVSVPRDLWYNGRKINAFAHYYGMPELKKVLSDISGYELDKYILIDMYAFIDVIDLIGGIDIHLDSAVIDPTYKTIDDGVVGTLHYEPGDYHLGGKEALRLARTRHTSSDFARAERQQLILEALQNKARNFGFGDADTIYEIVKTVLNQTETDIGIDEAIAYYFRYQNYEIMSNAVMSSGNVLYVPPYITTEDCARLEAEAEAAGQSDPGCANENHAYTLLPSGDNWNVVKWFFAQQFETI